MEEIPGLAFSVSAASRKARKNEADGRDYYFLTADAFRKKIAENAFVEWEEVYKDHFYGTLRTEVERLRNEGRHVVFDVDVKGGINIKKQFGDDALAIFVKPPSIEALEQRLRNRATDSEEDIRTRVEKAREELDFSRFYDLVILNDDLEEAKRETVSAVRNFILKSENKK